MTDQTGVPPIPQAPPPAPTAPVASEAAAGKPGRKAKPKRGYVMTVGLNPIVCTTQKLVIKNNPIEVDLDDWIMNQVTKHVLKLCE